MLVQCRGFISSSTSFFFGRSPLDASDQQRRPRLVHAEAPAAIRHLLQLSVLKPQTGAVFSLFVLCWTPPPLVPPGVFSAAYVHPLESTKTGAKWLPVTNGSTHIRSLIYLWCRLPDVGVHQLSTPQWSAHLSFGGFWWFWHRSLVHSLQCFIHSERQMRLSDNT